MPSWPALVIAPLVALGQQSVLYASTPLACASHDIVVLHAISGVCVLACLALTAVAMRREGTQSPRSGQDESAQERRSTLAQVAVMVGSLSTLVSLALWMPVWILSPCVN